MLIYPKNTTGWGYDRLWALTPSEFALLPTADKVAIDDFVAARIAYHTERLAAARDSITASLRTDDYAAIERAAGLANKTTRQLAKYIAVEKVIVECVESYDCL